METDSRSDLAAATVTIAALHGGAAPVAVRVFPGLPQQAREARRWVSALARATGHPDLDDAELAISELFGNAILHTRSGAGGGKVTVAVTADGVIHVHDYGPAGPCPGLSAASRQDGRREDHGQGLTITAALCEGLAHLPVAWCPVTGADDPSREASGCCTCCRPASWPRPPARAPLGAGRAAAAATTEAGVLR